MILNKSKLKMIIFTLCTFVISFKFVKNKVKTIGSSKYKAILFTQHKHTFYILIYLLIVH